MPFVVVCPNCKARLKAPEALVGKVVKCPGCGQQVKVPAPPPAPAPAPVIPSLEIPDKPKPPPPAQVATKPKPPPPQRHLRHQPALRTPHRHCLIACFHELASP